ncbi:hypothetical protein D9M69_619830 [compost metagenome]
MLVAGGDRGGDAHLQLSGIEGRVHFQPGRIARQPEQVAVVVARVEGGGEEHGGAAGGEARLEKGRRHQVAQAQARQATAAPAWAFAEVEQ